MKNLEKEAEYLSIENAIDYKPYDESLSWKEYYQEGFRKGVIRGAKTKWVQAEKIKAQIELLNTIWSSTINDSVKNCLIYYIEELRQELKQLKDETKI